MKTNEVTSVIAENFLDLMSGNYQDIFEEKDAEFIDSRLRFEILNLKKSINRPFGVLIANMVEEELRSIDYLLYLEEEIYGVAPATSESVALMSDMEAEAEAEIFGFRNIVGYGW